MSDPSSHGYLPLAAVGTGAMWVSAGAAMLAAMLIGWLWMRHRNASLRTGLLLGAMFGATLVRGVLMLIFGSHGHAEMAASAGAGGLSPDDVATYTSLWQAASLLAYVALWTLVARVLRASLVRSPQSRNAAVDRAIVALRGAASLLPIVFTFITYKMLVTGQLGSTACSRHGISGELLLGYDAASAGACSVSMWFSYVPAFALGGVMGLAAMINDRAKWARDDPTSWLAGTVLAVLLGLTTALATSDSVGSDVGVALFFSIENLLLAGVGLNVNANLELLRCPDAEASSLLGVSYAVDRPSQRTQDNQAAASSASITLQTV